MRFRHLLERHRRGEVVYQTDNKLLFHLTGPEGFTFAVDTNSLQGRYSHHVSTTWDVTMNHVEGRQAYAYKFALSGQKLAEQYGLYEYQHWVNYTTGGGTYLDERELVVNTSKISPLSSYMVALILNNPSGPLASTTFLHLHFQGLKGYTEKDAADACRVVRDQWNKPLWVQTGEKLRRASAAEQKYLQFVIDTARSSDNIDDLIYRVSRRYRLYDTFKTQPERSFKSDLLEPADDTSRDYFDRKRIARRHQRKVLDYLRNDDITEDRSRQIFQTFLDYLGYGHNRIAILTSMLDDHHAFHPVATPAWVNVLKSAIEEDEFEDVLKYARWDIEREMQHFEFRKRNYEDGMWGRYQPFALVH